MTCKAVDLYFSKSISFSPAYLERKVSLGRSVLLEKIVGCVDDFLSIRGAKIQVVDQSEKGELYCKVVNSEFSCVKSCMKIPGYLLVIPVIVALVIKLISHILLFRKYQLRQQDKGDDKVHQIATQTMLSNIQEGDTGGGFTVISQDLLAIFLDNFPKVIGDLLIEQNLNFEEFQEFMDMLIRIKLSGSLSVLPSSSLKEKLRKFGITRISRFLAAESTESLSMYQRKLKDVLLSHCPFMWLSNFCDRSAVGSNSFAISPVPREAWKSRASLCSYWVSRLGFSDENITIFSPVFWILAEALTDNEYKMLAYFSSTDSWEQVRGIISELLVRYRQYISRSPEFSALDIDESLFSKYLLLFMKHGFSLPGIRLLRSLTLDQLLTLQDLTIGAGGNRLSKWMKSLGGLFYNPDLPHAICLPFDAFNNFSQELLLLTWSELSTHGINKNDIEFSSYLSEICGCPIVIADPVSYKEEKQVRKYDLESGECVLTLQPGSDSVAELRWTNWSRSVHPKKRCSRLSLS
ncbi:hypothetical protein CP10139811_0186 [Chlamydia ibidis]|uniref:Uncharacterized protein n=2 Tax=Chlamydia ibidis TaxID=1405396 RepID=S7J5J0_9CHLA|nr:DUF1389 domain-containing protein [Chlamydia ibidis]EPP35302.1 hypothetical protein CP10139811_0186 [Chlamydia ibidis]EQM62696.1 hypothetical protein H359_0629 [Chlamydia ibidis 10-1398/6]